MQGELHARRGEAWQAEHGGFRRRDCGRSLDRWSGCQQCVGCCAPGRQLPCGCVLACSCSAPWSLLVQLQPPHQLPLPAPCSCNYSCLKGSEGMLRTLLPPLPPPSRARSIPLRLPWAHASSHGAGIRIHGNAVGKADWTSKSSQPESNGHPPCVGACPHLQLLPRGPLVHQLLQPLLYDAILT